jgi:hypothetical protein
MQGGHFFGRHPNGLANTGPDLFLKFRRHFGELAMVLASRGVAVLNCTPGSALTCFPLYDLATELEGVTSHV